MLLIIYTILANTTDFIYFNFIYPNGVLKKNMISEYSDL